MPVQTKKKQNKKNSKDAGIFYTDSLSIYCHYNTSSKPAGTSSRNSGSRIVCTQVYCGSVDPISSC